jgi:hypothetical protein
MIRFLPIRQQNLAERVVDFMRAGMEQVLALQINLRTAEPLRHPLRAIKRRGAAGIFFEKKLQLIAEHWVHFRLLIFRGQLVQRRHQRLGHEHAAVGAEMARRVGNLGQKLLHIWIKSRSRAWSFLPGEASTPLFTSTA